MKLISYEWKKISHNKILWGILGLLLVINFIIGYINSPIQKEKTYLQKILADYEQNPSEVDAYYEELKDLQARERQNAREAAQAGIPYEIIYPCTYSEDDQYYNDVYLMELFYTEILNYNSRYHASISKVIQSAQITQNEILSSYGLTETSFSYRKQKGIENAYLKMQENVKITPTIAKGWNIFFEFETSNILSLIMIVLISASLFTIEKDGSEMLLRSTKRGRRASVIAKLNVSAAVNIGMILLFTSSTLLAIGMKTGLSDPFQYAVIFSDFVYLPYPLTVLELLLISIGAKIIIGIALTAFVGLIANFIGNLTSVFTVALSPLIISYLVYVHSESMSAKFINPYGFFHIIPLFFRYYCFPIQNQAINYISFCFILFLMIWVLALFFAILTAKKHPMKFQQIRKLSGFIRQAFKRGGSFRLMKLKKVPLTFFYFELKKYVLKPLFVCLLLFICVLKIGFTFGILSPERNLDNTIYENYIHELAEMNVDEQACFLAEEQNRIDFAISAQENMKQRYLTEEISTEEYETYLKELSYAKSHSYIFQKVIKKHNYLVSVRTDKKIEPMFLYDIDWELYLTSGYDYALIILLILGLSGIFADEYHHRNGNEPMKNLLASTKCGRSHLFKAKITFAFVFAILFFILFSLVELFYSKQILHLPSKSAPIVSFPLFSDTDTAINLRTFCILRYVLRFVGTISITSVVLFFSELFQKRIYAISAMTVIITIPHICTTFGMNFMHFFDISMLLDGTRLYLWSSAFGKHDFILMGFFTLSVCVLSVILLWFTKKRFCKIEETSRKGVRK